MDYLITEGYPSAAEKFAMEANIDRRPDHSFIEQRVQIRDSIHRGDLQQAIELMNDLNPEVSVKRRPTIPVPMIRPVSCTTHSLLWL
jgi:glucose-induced degradation protein 8